MIVALLILASATSFTVQCSAPDMSVYSSTVSFTCTFSEAVSLHRVERVLVPNFVSVSPMEGEHTVFTVTAGVVDNTLGTMTLLLGEGAFATAQEESSEYSVSVACASLARFLMCR